MLSDSILANAGWLFFATYSAIVAVVNWAAFGRDVLPAKAQVDPSRKNSPTDRMPVTAQTGWRSSAPFRRGMRADAD